MYIKLKFSIIILYVFVCTDINAFTINNNINSINVSSSNYSTISNNNEQKKQNQVIELYNNNYGNLDTFINISDCEQLENIIEEIYDFNKYTEKRFNRKLFKSRSAFALNLSEELTEYAIELNQYESIYYAMNCYKTLTHLMHIIGKEQGSTARYSTNIGTVKLTNTKQKHITANKRKEAKLYKCSEKFIPFCNYFLDKIYPKIFTKLIDTSVLFKLYKTLERKSNEIVYINTSILPQVKYLISTANKINGHIVLIKNDTTLFKRYLYESIKSIKYWLSNESLNKEIINIVNMLKNSISNSKNNIEIYVLKCEELVDKIRNQVNNINSKQWSYAYNLVESLPGLAIKIHHNRNTIIESSFSFAHNLDYISRLIESNELSNDDNYNEEVYNILEELKYCNSILD